MLDTPPTITEVPDSAQDELRVTPTGEYTFEGHPVRILDRYTIDGRDFAIVQSLDGETLQWPHSTSMRQISASNLVEVRPAEYQPRKCLCGAAEGTQHSWDCGYPMFEDAADKYDRMAWDWACIAKRNELKGE